MIRASIHPHEKYKTVIHVYGYKHISTICSFAVSLSYICSNVIQDFVAIYILFPRTAPYDVECAQRDLLAQGDIVVFLVQFEL